MRKGIRLDIIQFRVKRFVLEFAKDVQYYRLLGLVFALLLIMMPI